MHLQRQEIAYFLLRSLRLQSASASPIEALLLVVSGKAVPFHGLWALYSPPYHRRHFLSLLFSLENFQSQRQARVIFRQTVFRPGAVSVLLKCCCFLGGLLLSCAGTVALVHCTEGNREADVWCADAALAEIARECCSDLHTGGELTGERRRSGLQHVSSFVTFIFFFFKHFLKDFPRLGDGRWGWKQERGLQKPGRKGSGEDFVFITRDQLWPRWSALILTSSGPKYLMFLFLFQRHLVLAGF